MSQPSIRVKIAGTKQKKREEEGKNGGKTESREATQKTNIWIGRRERVRDQRQRCTFCWAPLRGVSPKRGIYIGSLIVKLIQSGEASGPKAKGSCREEGTNTQRPNSVISKRVDLRECLVGGWELRKGKGWTRKKKHRGRLQKI